MRLIDALYYALSSPRGIAVKTKSFARTRARLYALRADLDDEALSILSFKEGPNGELWIVRPGNCPAEAHLGDDSQTEQQAAL